MSENKQKTRLTQTKHRRKRTQQYEKENELKGKKSIKFSKIWKLNFHSLY